MLSAKDLKEQINTLGADLVGVARADSPLLSVIFYSCSKCIAACPVGSK